jgi:hypothetical protein
MRENDFSKISYDEYSYDTPYLQHCTVKIMLLDIFFLREFSSAAPNVDGSGLAAAHLNCCRWYER